jgi:23S rRNA (adenine2503-C2)-methyltransferase
MEKLFGKTLKELQELVLELGMSKFTAKQLCEWIYQKHAATFDDMTNISKKNKELLNSKFQLGVNKAVKVQKSVDGTKKYLFKTEKGDFIETAMIPDKDRKTICVSSQVGCKMGCLFCMTGRQGFQANLTAGEILNQYQNIDESQDLTNIVYMGMGEPLDNLNEVMKSIEILTSEWGYALSPKRITVSSIGIIPGMKEFLEHSKCHLAISLHTPFDDERKNLMPVQQVYPIKEVIDTIKSFDFGLQRKLTFEYIMFDGVNDTDKHVKEMARLLNGMRSKVNLIKFHPIPGSPLKGCNRAKMERFRDELNKKGIIATVRASRGEDIFAACGLLSTKEHVKKEEDDY